MKKIALITGAATRLGKEIALHLDSSGWSIAIHCNKSISEAKNLQKQLKSKSIIIQQDFLHLDGLDSIFKEIETALGSPTLLINNASIFYADTNKISKDHLNDNMQVNCFSPIMLTEKFCTLPGTKNVINIVDSSIMRPLTKFVAYAISKKALLYSTKCLAMKYAPHCRINAISPGMLIEPEATEQKELFHRLVQSSPLKKQTKIEEILKAIDLIIAAESMTAQNIILDSGRSSLTPDSDIV